MISDSGLLFWAILYNFIPCCCWLLHSQPTQAEAFNGPNAQSVNTQTVCASDGRFGIKENELIRFDETVYCSLDFDSRRTLAEPVIPCRNEKKKINEKWAV